MPLNILCYLALLLVVSMLGMIRWKHFALPERIVAALICVTTITETTALFFLFEFGNNVPVYHFYSPVEFVFICMYFNCIIPFFKKYRIGMVLGASGLVLSIANTLYFQDIKVFNSNFLLFEATVIIVCSQIYLRNMFLDEDTVPYSHATFWITMCFIFFWSTTFTCWGIYAVLDRNERMLNPIIITLLSVANYVFYSAMGVIFLLHKKLIPNRA